MAPASTVVSATASPTCNSRVLWEIPARKLDVEVMARHGGCTESSAAFAVGKDKGELVMKQQTARETPCSLPGNPPRAGARSRRAVQPCVISRDVRSELLREAKRVR